ncbi:MAG: cyclase family protein [Chloroflexota bacterium]
MASLPVLGELIDITVPYSPAVPTWPGHPTPTVEPMTRIANGDRSNVSMLHIGSHAGTHLDANWHFIDTGKKLLEIPVDRWVGPGWVAHIPEEAPAIEVRQRAQAGIPAGTTRLLLRTGNSTIWGTWDGVTPLTFNEHYVGLTPDAARWLVDHGIQVVGIDYLSIGRFGPENVVCHNSLLGNDVLIIENLDLSRVPAGPDTLGCLPLQVAFGVGAPGRAVLGRR